MSWGRWDDKWPDRKVVASLSLEARWQYFCMVQFCCRNDRVDGVMTVKEAKRCSDLDDPGQAIGDLVEVGLLEPEAGLQVRIVEIHDHVPPPGVRLNAEKSKIRMRRKRAHDAGDHSLCLPDNCPDVTDFVTRNPGSGRDGSGKATRKKKEESGGDAA